MVSKCDIIWILIQSNTWNHLTFLVKFNCLKKKCFDMTSNLCIYAKLNCLKKNCYVYGFSINDLNCLVYSSTEKDIDTRLTKAWTAIDRLSIIWKSDLTDKMKSSFFQAAVVSILLYGCTTWTLTKTAGEETRRKLHKNVKSSIEQVLATTPHETPIIRKLAPNHENYTS